jgi:hypothetical protein
MTAFMWEAEPNQDQVLDTVSTANCQQRALNSSDNSSSPHYFWQLLAQQVR